MIFWVFKILLEGVIEGDDGIGGVLVVSGWRLFVIWDRDIVIGCDFNFICNIIEMFLKFV